MARHATRKSGYDAKRETIRRREIRKHNGKAVVR